MPKLRCPCTLVILVAFAATGAIGSATRAAADGEVDPSFGLAGDGIAVLPTAGEYELLALAPGSERFVAAGVRRGGDSVDHLHWWSVDWQGIRDLDRTCAGATGTTFPSSFGVASRANCALVDSTGRLVVGGWMTVLGSETQERALVARFELAQPGCALDTSFSGNGWDRIDTPSFCASDDCEVLDLVEQTPATTAVSARRYVLLLRATSGGLGASRLFLWGITAAGATDTSFGGGDGWVELQHAAFGAALFRESRLERDSLGRLWVLVTHADALSAVDLDVSLLRYRPNGTLDTAYGTQGLEPLTEVGPDAADARARMLAVDSGGTVGVVYEDADFVVSILPAGVPFTAFGTGGSSTTLAFQSDRRWLWHRDAGADGVQVWRHLAAPPYGADPAWNGGGGPRELDVDLGGDNAETVTAMATWGGRIVLGGLASTDGGERPFLVRLTNAHVFSSDFEGGTAADWSAVVGTTGP